MHDALEHIPNEALLATVRRLTARSNVALADLLAHLGEVERRGIHRERACASLYAYCVYELRMSEDAAFRRAKAARLVRRYPEVRDAIAKGEIHLTGLLTIAPYLGGEHHEEVLRRSRFRSKRELCRLIAEIDPKPAVPALVEPIGPALAGRAGYAAHIESLTGAVRELPEGSRPEDWIDEGEPETDEARFRDDTPSGHEARAGHEARTDEARLANDAGSPVAGRPLHYKVQFTASQEYVDLLEEAVALLGHERPRPALPDVQLRALQLLVAKLRKERRGERSDAKAEAAERTAPARASSDECDKSGTDVTAPARASSPRRDTERGVARVGSFSRLCGLASTRGAASTAAAAR